MPNTNPEVLDSFTDTDGVALEDHIMDVGPGWVKWAAPLQIQAGYASNLGLGTFLYTVATDFTNGVLQALCYNRIWNANVGLCFRASDVHNYWRFYKRIRAYYPLDYYLENIVSGEVTIVGIDLNVRDTPREGSGPLSVVMSGSNIKCYHGGLLVFNVNSLSLAANTQHGLYGTAVRDTWLQRWDDFEFNASCRGPLVDICTFLRQVGTFFINLSLDIAELWLIGGFLSTPFELLGELFYAGASSCCSASSGLETILVGLEAGVTADALLTLILENWPTLYYLITDPAGWFLVQLTLAFNLEPWHTQSLEFLAKWVLETYFPTLYQIWLNPEDWFTILLRDRFPILYYLVVDPTGEILYLIGQAFDLTPWEAQSAEFIVKALFERYFSTLYQIWLDPEDWLVEHVDPRILGLPATVAAFFDDPWGWLFDRLEDQLETYTERIGDIALEIIARLLGV